MAKHVMKVGFDGDNKSVQVDLPDGDIKPWDLDSKLSVVGTSPDRLDGLAKATGTAKYAFDINLPNMLQGVLVRSKVAAGKVTKIDWAAAAALEGVHAIVPLKQVGERDQVRFVGDPICAIAAETRDLALDAAEKIVIEYAAEPAVIDDLTAERAPTTADGVVTEPWPEDDKGELDAAFANAKTTLEGTWRCEVQTHSALESHGHVCSWNDKDGSLEVWASTQATFGVRSGLASALDIPQDKVLVHAEFVGGGFGAKFSPGAEGVACAMLSREAKRPVKLMLDRFEEHTCAGNRPSALVQIRAGLDADGKLTAWDYRSWGAPGYPALGPRARGGGATRFPRHYLSAAKVREAQVNLGTHTDAGRAMRAPGYPQGYFAAEGMIDALAMAIGVDPLELRQKNDPEALRQAEWTRGAEAFGWKDKWQPWGPRDASARTLRGAGCSSAAWGQMGNRGRGRPNSVTVRIHSDATVEIRNGAQDIGTGLKTILAMLAAEELQVPAESVRVVVGDTREPAGPGSGGSTTTPSLAPAARLAANLAKRELTALVAKHLGVEADAVKVIDGKWGAKAQKFLSFEDACKLIGHQPIDKTGERFNNYEGYKDNVCGCQFAAVEVDTQTGFVKVTDLLAVQDCGVVLNEKLAESQVLGAMIGGISYALHEQRIMDRKRGRMLNGDMLFYKVAGAKEMPTNLKAIMFPVRNGKNNVGAAGLGEPPAVATPAAIANAVANAIGAPIRSMPITPDKVLAALASTRQTKNAGDQR